MAFLELTLVMTLIELVYLIKGSNQKFPLPVRVDYTVGDRSRVIVDHLIILGYCLLSKN
jgi:hypothetical protein